MAKKKQRSILDLSITSQHELEDFKNEIFEVAESKKISMETMKALPWYLKREIKRNSKNRKKKRAFAIDKLV
jgi:hypothetical protein